MKKDSKPHRICKYLFDKGWKVDEHTGEVIKPDGTIKSVQKRKNKRMTYLCFNVKHEGQRGRHWYNDGEKSYLLFPEQAEGLIKGRLNKNSS